MPQGSSLQVARDLLGKKVADVLREQIVSNQIPPSTRLVEDELAARLGTSRGPIREALAALAREGLVTGAAGKGVYAKGVTADGIRQVYTVRMLLEPYTAGVAAERATAELAARLRALLEGMRSAEAAGKIADLIRLDLELHDVIWRASGNELLVESLERLIAPCGALFALNAEREADWSAVVEQHRELVEAIASGDGETARRAMADHLADSQDKALRTLAAREPSAAGRPESPAP